MVTFKPQGRLGNFLFCAATAIAYAKDHGLEWTMPSQTNDQKANPIYFPHLVKKVISIYSNPVIIGEKNLYKYDELPFSEQYRNEDIVLKGYFQNPLYFEKYKQEIIPIFDFNKFKYWGFVSVHVRRGDYLTLQEKHPLVTKEWYENAMDQFKGYKFCFFSDDIEWCKAEFGSRKDCFFSEGQDELTDLIKLSCCEHHINSASTFSWWGAWADQNPNKKVILPKRWLTESHSNQWTEEIVPKEWIRVG